MKYESGGVQEADYEIRAEGSALRREPSSVGNRPCCRQTVAALSNVCRRKLPIGMLCEVTRRLHCQAGNCSRRVRRIPLLDHAPCRVRRGTGKRCGRTEKRCQGNPCHGGRLSAHGAQSETNDNGELTPPRPGIGSRLSHLHIFRRSCDCRAMTFSLSGASGRAAR